MIAMSLACGSPKLLIADEPTTALDVTIQAQILELFQKLQQEIGMSVILITHDLGVVAETANRVAVMYAGSIVETAAVAELFRSPLHPYTRGLLRSLPQRGKGRRKETLYSIPGTVPDLLKLKPGCKFFDRCSYAVAEICLGSEPAIEKIKTGHEVRCRRVDDMIREESAGWE
jgi:oligopeptide/dipeptide ABC transporter ATP-binding protein